LGGETKERSSQTHLIGKLFPVILSYWFLIWEAMTRSLACTLAKERIQRDWEELSRREARRATGGEGREGMKEGRKGTHLLSSTLVGLIDGRS